MKLTVTVSPVGICTILTADSVLLMCYPPGTWLRIVAIFNSKGLKTVPVSPVSLRYGETRMLAETKVRTCMRQVAAGVPNEVCLAPRSMPCTSLVKRRVSNKMMSSGLILRVSVNVHALQSGGFNTRGVTSRPFCNFYCRELRGDSNCTILLPL
jgi:hypothetical protein